MDNDSRYPWFVVPAVTALANEATRLAITLPRKTKQLIDAVCDDNTLKTEIDDVLKSLGIQIWGRSRHRMWLLKAGEAKAYEKDLEFQDEGDRAVIVHHLRSWIFLKAANMIRNNTRPKGREPAGKSSSAIVADKGDSNLNDTTAVTWQSSPARQMETHLDSDAASIDQDVSVSLTPQVQIEQGTVEVNDFTSLPPLPAVHLQQLKVINTAKLEAVNQTATSQVPWTGVNFQHPRLSALPLDKYWTEEEWSRVSEDPFSTSETIWKCLGLNHDANFPALIALRDEIRAIGLRIYVQLPKEDDFLECAASSDYLDEDIDILLDEYAPRLWGIDADRSSVGPDNARGSYRKGLVYEDDDDRKMLWLHLHQLVFLGALAAMEDYGDSESLTLFGRELVTQQQAQLAEKCVVPHRIYAPRSSQGEAVPLDGLKRDAPVLSVESNESDKENKKPPPQVMQASATIESRPAKRQKVDPDVPSPKEQPKSSKPKSPTYTDPSNLTTSILAYLRNYGNPTFDEHTILRDIELGLDKLPDHSFDTSLYNDTFPAVLSAWLFFRCAILSLQRQVSNLDESSAMNRKIHKARLLTQLRQERDAFQASTDLVLSAEHILCVGFSQLQGTIAEGDAVRRELQKGFDKLDEGLLALGNRLGDGRWIFMGSLGRDRW